MTLPERATVYLRHTVSAGYKLTKAPEHSTDATIKGSRTPEIMADAAHAILTSPAAACSGNFFIDEDLLRARGEVDFEKYATAPGSELIPDYFL